LLYNKRFLTDLGADIRCRANGQISTRRIKNTHKVTTIPNNEKRIMMSNCVWSENLQQVASSTHSILLFLYFRPFDWFLLSLKLYTMWFMHNTVVNETKIKQN